MHRPPFPFTRDVAGLRDGRFDVLVVGGGIYGAWAALDAAQRGLSVALIEKTDWGAGTSQSSSKLIHGGLRYLEHYEFRLVRHALHERKVLHRIAPHLVRPLDFILPVFNDQRVGPFMLSCGLTLYDLMGMGGQPVRRHRYFRARRLRRDYPYLDARGLEGGFRYGDCQEDDARMSLVVAAAAHGAGAVCANGVEALTLDAEGAEVQTDEGERFRIRARRIINTAGPWAMRLLGEDAPPTRLVKGMHLVMPGVPGLRNAFLLTAEAQVTFEDVSAAVGLGIEQPVHPVEVGADHLGRGDAHDVVLGQNIMQEAADDHEDKNEKGGLDAAHGRSSVIGGDDVDRGDDDHRDDIDQQDQLGPQAGVILGHAFFNIGRARRHVGGAGVFRRPAFFQLFPPDRA